MRRLGILFSALMGIALIAFVFSSCSEDPLPPLVEIRYTMGEDGYTVSFSATIQNDVKTYSWDFGDGVGTSTQSAPQYTFPKSGAYSVTLTVTGDGGSASDQESITIEATVTEYLTGGPGDLDGKTWILSRSATIGIDGVSAVDPNYAPVYLPLPNDALVLFGLGEEYDNEFTFFYDGKFTIKGINTAVLYGYVFGEVNQIEKIIDPGTVAGMYAGTFTDVTNGSFTLHEETDLTINTCNEDYPTGITDPPEDVTFSDVDYLSFGEGSHFGIKDFNGEVIIRSISADEMTVSLFLSTLNPMDYPEWFTKPSLLITATYEAK